MADVFISYSRDDRDWVQALAAQIEAQGLTVWWDIHNRPGQNFDTQIERELNAAKSVIVVWSKDSVGSRWVRAEAGDAMERGILVPILKDATVPPLAFRQIHCANLSGWKGGLTGELPGLIAELRALAGKQADKTAAVPNFAHEAPTAAELALLDRARETIARPSQDSSRRQPPPRRAKRSPLLWLTAGLVASLAGAALYLTPSGQPEDAGPEALVPTVEPGSETPAVADLPEGDTLQTAPQPTKRVTPRYPRRAEERQREGSVALDVTVGEGGAVTAVRIVSETPTGFGFGDAAEAAVRQWEFATARPGRYAVTVKFTLN